MIADTPHVRIIESPNIVPDALDLFIAGGISNCPDWQCDFIRMLSDVDAVAANPRRSGEFDASYGREQIAWERTALSRSRCVSFWFPEETLCPISWGRNLFAMTSSSSWGQAQATHVASTSSSS